MALTKIDDRGLKTPVDLLDNEKIRLGTGNDLQIYASGSHSVIAHNGDGNLQITTGASGEDILIQAYGDIDLKPANGENGVKILGNGAVSIYHDNGARFTTQSWGTGFDANFGGNDNIKLNLGNSDDLQIFHDGSNRINYSNGNLVIKQGTHSDAESPQFDGNGSLYIPDNNQVYFGASADLKIYHDGSHSYIKDDGTGQLRLQTSLLSVENAGGTENILSGTADGAVELYYDAVKKFETHSNGCIFTGDLYGLDTAKIRLGNSNDFEIRHDGNHSSLIDTGPGWLQLLGEKVKLANSDGSETFLQVERDGGVKLYYDNSNKFETHASGVSVFGQLSNSTSGIGSAFADNTKAAYGTGDDLQIYHSGTESWINNTTGDLILRNSASTGDVYIQAGGAELGVKVLKDGATELYHDNSKKIETTSYGIIVPDGSGYTNRTSGSNKGWYVEHGGTTVGRLFQNGTGPEGILELLNNGTQKILVNGDNGTYYGVNTTVQALSSERRTKENITSIDDTKSWSTLKDIKLYSFSYKNDTNSDTHYGPIVDEIPTDMKVPTSNSDDVGVINTYNSELLLFRAYSTIKQLVTKVETLETKVAALEAA